MAAQRILVIGGGGMLGAPVAASLAAYGFRVRILSRDPAALRSASGIEVLRGDVLAPDALCEAARDCSGVHVSLRGRTLDEAPEVEVKGVAAVARLCAEQGLRMTYLSNAGLDAAAADNAFARIKLDAESAIKASGAAFTIFRATHFMESLDLFFRDGRATILGRQPHRYHYLAARDFADMVARSFVMPSAEGRTLDVLGPEAFTMREALQAFVAEVRPGTPISELPLPVARLAAWITGAADFRHAVALFSSFAAMPEASSPAVMAELFGPAPTTLAAWCAARRAAAPS